MSPSHRHHRHSGPRPRVSRLELAIFWGGLALSVVAGVVAYRIVGLYGDGAFSIGYRGHIKDPETGRMLLVHESRSADGTIIRRIIDGTTLKEVETGISTSGNAQIKVHVDAAKNITVVERDQNGDGKTDLWEYYDSQKRLIKTGFALAGDGVLNAWTYRDAQNQVTKVEVSTRSDGVVDRWEYYEKGQLARVELDTNHDGKVDRWQTYQAGILWSTADTPPPGQN